MKFINPIWGTACFSLALLSGCGNDSTGSDNIESSDFYTSMHATSKDANSTDVTIYFNAGTGWGADSIQLSGGDNLYVSSNGQTKEPWYDMFFAGYHASFDFNGSGSEFVVSLYRNGHDDMPESKVQLPNQFDITAPDSGLVFTAADDLTVTWGPVEADQPVKVHLSVYCVSDDEEDIDGREWITESETMETDQGIFVFSIADILADVTGYKDIDTSQHCTGHVEVSKTRYGTVDPNYGKGGSFYGVQERKVEVIIDPKPLFSSE